MKVCESWLRDWVTCDLSGDALAHGLTMLGLEVEAVTAVAPDLRGVVVGEVLATRRHQNADKLTLCRVSIGHGEPLAIVCGATNVRVGGRYPTATEGARLPGGMEIRRTRVRGEESCGMLCSAEELGLESGAASLLELPDDAPVGASVAEVLQLDDRVIDLNLTPNRADCFSIAGIAREVSLLGGRLHAPAINAVAPAISDQLRIDVADGADCPRFAGRVIRNVKAQARTPLWLKERLRRCGIRPIHPVVDVTNYVMLELGQPMHAYDLQRVRGGIHVRRARDGEKLQLLDGRELALDGDFLVIADDAGAVGLAGIMGGANSGVDADSRDIGLESAFFAPAAVAGRPRRLGLHTDASLRFERGVDPTLQVQAIERATAMIIGIAGGQAGPVTERLASEELPRRAPVRLRRGRLRMVLGLEVGENEVTRILDRLGMGVTAYEEGWQVTAPPARFDIEREEDLIEEVARVYGYDRIPETPGLGPLHLGLASESRVHASRIRCVLTARGYQESIHYSFVEPAMDRLFAGDASALALANPISADLAVMRQSLWPGLVQTLSRNLNRQQERLRLFEIGVAFVVQDNEVKEQNILAGAVLGDRFPEQWGSARAGTDVFDAKADIEAVLRLTGATPEFCFEPGAHPALHPGRAAVIRRGEAAVGWVGELHPAVQARLDLNSPPILFELAIEPGFAAHRPTYQGISRFPAVRRDLAVVVDRKVAASAVVTAARHAAEPLLRDVIVFDIYTGPQVGPSEKSIAMGLILQDASRTLNEGDVDSILQSVVAALGRELDARIRE